jgi:hypothetical protein
MFLPVKYLILCNILMFIRTRESLYGLLFVSGSASVKAIKSEFIALANSQSRKIYLGFQLDPVALFFVCVVKFTK